MNFYGNPYTRSKPFHNFAGTGGRLLASSEAALALRLCGTYATYMTRSPGRQPEIPRKRKTVTTGSRPFVTCFWALQRPATGYSLSCGGSVCRTRFRTFGESENPVSATLSA
jgi:hypothetical protein